MLNQELNILPLVFDLDVETPYFEKILKIPHKTNLNTNQRLCIKYQLL